MMLCPKCERRTEVYDSRPAQGTTRRGRVCTGCGHRFRTIEVLEAAPEKPKRKPVIAKKVKKRKGPVREPDVVIVDFSGMSDEELESAIFEGDVRFDEDEL